jgi:Uma2 family endonuclease
MIVAMVVERPLEASLPSSNELLTAEDLFSLPRTFSRPELNNGKLVQVPPSGGLHGLAHAAVGAVLVLYAERSGQGEVFGRLGFVFSRNPDTVRAPDVAFISTAQLRERPNSDGYYEGYPDLVVEIISPNDRMRDVEEKVQQYFDAGTRLVWLVRPEAQAVMVRYPDGSAQLFRGEDVLSGEDVLPGFEVKLTELFED